MRKSLLCTLVIFAFFSCKKAEDVKKVNVDNPSGEVIITSKEDVNQTAILPAAKEYYQNIAAMADWYAKHPEARRRSNLKSANEPDSINTLLAKLEEISIADSTNAEVSIFELDQAKRDTFLNTFVVIEANNLSEKLKIDTSNQALSTIVATNMAFKQAFTSLKSATTTIEDPYWTVRGILDSKEKQNVSSLKSVDDSFWAKVIANGILSYSIIQVAPISLTPQTFVDRIKPSIAKGRLLIALPGGWTTSSIIVFYPNKQWYDVGHVAVMSKNSSDITSTIGRDFNFTIGTNSDKGMHDEEVGDSWCDKHGLAFVGQVYDVQWKWFYKNWRNWGWRRESRDVNNNNIYNKVYSTRGTPYCNIFQVLTAKWAAPGHFICSSSAWWCAKEGCDVNIGDWWKPTIFPAGVYLSDRVRIIDNTLN
jgi:hypothetical protein